MGTGKGTGLVEGQEEEGAAPGSVRSSETWVPLEWTVSSQGVGQVSMGELEHVVERGLGLVPGEQEGKWQWEVVEQVRYPPLGAWGGLHP